MKKIEINQMEEVKGGNILDGACTLLGLTGGGIAVRFLIGATMAIPGWGLAVLAVGTIGCSIYAVVK